MPQGPIVICGETGAVVREEERSSACCRLPCPKSARGAGPWVQLLPRSAGQLTGPEKEDSSARCWRESTTHPYCGSPAPSRALGTLGYYRCNAKRNAAYLTEVPLTIKRWPLVKLPAGEWAPGLHLEREAWEHAGSSGRNPGGY